ncbi:TIGR04283 family arsenosugar biosynthesis glycosyltransferase [Thermotalea metallivorans]|uniref:4,4'-diaponeurosporenoate glycosyltransferase n=1 Tax=Thermotalea metallivorans TaxID=520762 RepID=A0A140KZZ0_9FIRM|nr:TIGR04283 family arsenosugar biosynthesis glycosyltransferase [Thermotalea metallivorans]KXG73865.1 Glucosyl-3-phosphoglycerate synthase [Thermotalea metallivorans]
MVSIIIPVLNEERNIKGLLEQLNTLDGKKEIIVVDGGSCDRTVEIAADYARVICSEKGRAKQMNKGAEAAKGDILWFVHSDSIVHERSLQAMYRAVSQGYAGGGFSLYFYDYPTKFMKFVAITSNMRAKYFGLFFGDQGIFVKKSVFFQLGEYPDIELMEDWEFSRKLFKTSKTVVLDVPLGTSARRFKKRGQLRTLLLMHKIKLLYILGVHPSKLKEMYREVRS